MTQYGDPDMKIHIDDSQPILIRAETDNPFEWGKDVMLKMAKLEEERIKNAIIGAKITDIEYNPIKGRKHMYELVIKTDAEKVPRLQFGQGYMLHNMIMPVIESTTHFLDLSEIRVRTKTKPPFYNSSNQTIIEDENNE